MTAEVTRKMFKITCIKSTCNRIVISNKTSNICLDCMNGICNYCGKPVDTYTNQFCADCLLILNKDQKFVEAKDGTKRI